MPNYPAQIGPLLCGKDQPLLWIAGPCVLESRESAFEIATELQRVARLLSVQLVFKASFDKANRTSSSAYRGPGLKEGLKILREIGQTTGLPVTTDIHESSQAAAVGRGLRPVANTRVSRAPDRSFDCSGPHRQSGKCQKGPIHGPRRHAVRRNQTG